MIKKILFFVGFIASVVNTILAFTAGAWLLGILDIGACVILASVFYDLIKKQ